MSRRTAWLWITAALFVFWLGMALIAKSAIAHHGRGCHTKKCEVRVFNKNQKFRPALASWYDGIGLGGVTACLGHRPPSWWRSANAVAHKTLPCGTKLRICFRRCTDGTVWDRGPYSGVREFDLDRAVRDDTGFDGVGTIRVKVVR